MHEWKAKFPYQKTYNKLADKIAKFLAGFKPHGCVQLSLACISVQQEVLQYEPRGVEDDEGECY